MPANGNGAPASGVTGQLIAAMLSGRITKWAGIPIVLAGCVKVAYWLPFFHFVPGEADQLSTGLFYIAVGIAIVGIAGKQKSASDLYVQREAEKSILDRGLPPKSSVPAIQNAIDTMHAEGTVIAAPDEGRFHATGSVVLPPAMQVIA